jgi:hypothetical protein
MLIGVKGDYAESYCKLPTRVLATENVVRHHRIIHKLASAQIITEHQVLRSSDKQKRGRLSFLKSIGNWRCS